MATRLRRRRSVGVGGARRIPGGSARFRVSGGVVVCRLCSCVSAAVRSCLRLTRRPRPPSPSDRDIYRLSQSRPSWVWPRQVPQGWIPGAGHGRPRFRARRRLCARAARRVHPRGAVDTGRPEIAATGVGGPRTSARRPDRGPGRPGAPATGLLIAPGRPTRTPRSGPRQTPRPYGPNGTLSGELDWPDRRKV